MRVVTLTQGADHVCYRYRVEPFDALLRARGWTLEAIPLAKQTFRRLGQFLRIRSADVVILQRKVLSRWQLALLRRAAKTLIYDVDDAVFLHSGYHADRASGSARQSGFQRTCAAADAVLAGNDHLAAEAARFAPLQRVHRVPTCVDPALYAGARHERRTRGIRLAWIGKSCNLPGLEQAASLLAQAADRLEDLEVRVICDEFPRFERLRVVPRPWSQQSEAAELAEADIGISWLPDDAWSRGKCGLKVLQFMAAGLPVVANPVGTNPEMVVHGETGFLASTAEQWSQAIETLANDPALRARLGAAARRRVEEHYSASAWGPKFVAIIEHAANSSRAVPTTEAAA